MELTGPKLNHENSVLALLVAVPPEDREAVPCFDIAEAYAVETCDEIPGGCIIWGMYHGKWQANVSGRWLVSRFIKSGASVESFAKHDGMDVTISATLGTVSMVYGDDDRQYTMTKEEARVFALEVLALADR